MVSETIDSAAADAFTYDGAGRLATATVSGVSRAYDFGDASGCAVANAGRNTNRKSVTDAGVATTYCYDQADRLVSSTDTAVGTPAYDDPGNTTTLGTQTLAYVYVHGDPISTSDLTGMAEPLKPCAGTNISESGARLTITETNPE